MLSNLRQAKVPVLYNLQALTQYPSARFVVMPWLLTYEPKEVQNVFVGQDTHLKALRLAPLGLGGDWTSHSVPFQCSAKVIVVPELFTYSPVSVQEVAEEHDTPLG